MRMTRFGYVGIGLLLAAVAHGGNGEWTTSGPLGGRVHELVFDPGNPLKAYATTYGGVFRSNDGGTTWSSASNGIVADTYYPLPLILDAEQPNRLYSFDSWGRIYRTDNGGTNWAIMPDTLPSNVHPSVLADKPGIGCTILLGTATDTSGHGPMLFKSTDCGQSFFQIGAGLPTDEAVTAIAFDPTDVSNNTLLVGLDAVTTTELHAIWRSTDGGATFTPTFSTFEPGSGGRPEVNQIDFDAAGRVWTGVGSYALFHSIDSGVNWTSTGATGVSAIAADPDVADRVWVGGADEAGRVDFDGSLYTYTTVNDGLSGNPTYDDGFRPVPAGVDRLAFRPSAPTKLFASTEGSGIFSLTTTPVPLWTPVSTQPAGAGIRAVAVHPTTPQVLLAGQATFSVSSPALYRTINGGTNWSPSNVELEAADIQAIVFDPTTTGSVPTSTFYAGGRSATNFNVGFHHYGLYRSDNGGQTWLTLDGNLPSVSNHTLGAIRGIALDPNSCTVPPCLALAGPLQRVYAVGHGRTENDVIIAFDTHRVLRSDDRGSTWTALDGNPGFPASNRNGINLRQRVTPTVIVVDPNDAQRLYVGTEAQFYDYDTGDAAVLDPTRQSGLFTSSDGGANWTRVPGLPPKTNSTIYPNASLDVVDLLIDRSGGRNVLWIALRDLYESGSSTIYRSANGGASWQQMDEGLNSSLELRDLAIDPSDPNVLYAATGGDGANPGAIYRGVWDNATSSIRWLSISVGLPAESAYAIAVDPTNPNQLHAGTDTGVHSITRLPDQDGDGIPDSVEDQAPDVPGGLSGLGDGNGDGQLDSAQREVGSSVVIFRRGGSTAVTSSIVSGTGPGIGACTQAVDISLIAPDALAVDIDPVSGQTYGHDFAARQFDITQCATAVVDITYHGANFASYGWSFRYFGPAQPGELEEVGWYAWPQAQRIGASTWRLQLTADAFGSYRPEPDAIRFVGGPACLDDRVYVDSFETAPALTPGCAD
jgi:photosystem II stability/assembly factor-like uncharacterized protein